MSRRTFKEHKLGRHVKGAEPDKPEIKGFNAKFTGTCMICKEAVAVGEHIRWFSYGNVMHVECI